MFLSKKVSFLLS